MLPFLVAAALATAPPSPCPSDLLVANPRLKVVRAIDKTQLQPSVFCLRSSMFDLQRLNFGTQTCAGVV